MVKKNKEQLKEVGRFHIDSGKLWIGDYCYKDKIDDESLGFICNTKYGDGKYKVYMMGDNGALFIPFDYPTEWEIPAMTLNEYEALKEVLYYLIKVSEEEECYLEAKERGDDVSNHIYKDIKVIADWYNNQIGREYF